MTMSYTRRGFIKLVSSGIGGGLIGAGIIACATTIVYHGSIRSGILEYPLSEFYENIGDNYGLLISAFELGDTIILIEDGEGEFIALSATCTHQGCQVKIKEHFFSCPCHGSTYDGNGNVVRGPAQKSLRSFPVNVSSELIKIELT